MNQIILKWDTPRYIAAAGCEYRRAKGGMASLRIFFLFKTIIY